MLRTELIQEKRKGVLKSAYKRATDPDHPFTLEQLRELHDKIAARATASRHPDPKEQWILKLTNIFENMAPVKTYDDRLALALAVERTYRDNKLSFMSVNPDACFVALQRTN